MSRLRNCILALALALFAIQLGGCPGDKREEKTEHQKELKAEHDRPLPTTVDELRDERDELEDRLARVGIALKRAADESVQLKIWLGVGALGLAALVLIAIGVWTTRRIFVELGLACIGLAGLGALAAWLVPYILWIGLGVALAVIGVAIWMLANREKALKQVTEAVDTAKQRLPEFAANYKNIFREHIDTGMENVVNAVREVKK